MEVWVRCGSGVDFGRMGRTSFSSAENDTDKDVAASRAIEACSTIDLVRCRELPGRPSEAGGPRASNRLHRSLDEARFGWLGRVVDLVAFQLIRRPLRGQEGPVERFVGVDVPDARQHRLVQQPT